MCAKKIQWAAQLAGVQEVTLLGTANLSHWTRQLAKHELRPLEKDGLAQVLVISAASRYMGLRFSEMSVSIVLASANDVGNQQKAFLVHAFNSRWLFAFCERVLFATPYYYSEVRLAASVPASIEVAERGAVLFRAEMKCGDSDAAYRKPTRCAEGGWEGAVHLPSRGRNGRPRRLFFARIRGLTKTYPFVPQVDACFIQPGKNHEVLQSLIESQFVPTEWIIRENATHAKSKTYRKTDLH